MNLYALSTKELIRYILVRYIQTSQVYGYTLYYYMLFTEKEHSYYIIISKHRRRYTTFLTDKSIPFYIISKPDVVTLHYVS